MSEGRFVAGVRLARCRRSTAEIAEAEKHRLEELTKAMPGEWREQRQAAGQQVCNPSAAAMIIA
jgi:hypothetical protein